MATNYVNTGDTLEYVNTGSAISAGDVVVMTGFIGVALTDIAATTGVGTVAIKGVFNLVKVTGAVIAQGSKVVWDNSATNLDDSLATKAAGDFDCGVAMEAAGSGVLVIAVDINTQVSAVT